VTYEGSRYVHVAGRQSAMIDRAAVAGLVAEVVRSGFFELKDRYDDNITDLPTTYVTVEIDSRKKRVIDYAGAPHGLRDLEREIDRVTNSRRWVSLDPETLVEKQRSTSPFDKRALTVELVGALRRAHLDTAEALIAAGADPSGDPIFSARSADAVQLLIRSGAKVDVRNHAWRTPLMEAVSAGDAALVRALLAAGADPRAKDRDGHTVLEFATTSDLGCMSQAEIFVRFPTATGWFERAVTADDCRAIADLIRAALAKGGGLGQVFT